MHVSKDSHRLELEFEHPSELAGWTPEERDYRSLVLRETQLLEVPERDGREVDLAPLLASLPSLEIFMAATHLWSPTLEHTCIKTMFVEGAISETPLRMPSLTSLGLWCGGDAHGVALDFSEYGWLLDGVGLPSLRELDMRFLDVECYAKPSFLQRWCDSALLPRLRRLGLPPLMSTRELKKHKDHFAHLELLVISNLQSALDKNPLGGNVFFESELNDVALVDVPEASAALPRPSDLTPSLSDEELHAQVARLIATGHRFELSVLQKTLFVFAKKKQWKRLDALLFDFAKKVARTKRIYMDLREALEAKVRSAVGEQPGPPDAQALLERIEAENRI